MRRRLSACVKGVSFTLGRLTWQHRHFRPSLSLGRPWSGALTWSGISRGLLLFSLTCLSRWTSSPCGSRRNLMPKPTPRMLSSSSLTLSTGSVCPTPSSQTIGQTSQARGSWSSLMDTGSGLIGRRSGTHAPTGRLKGRMEWSFRDSTLHLQPAQNVCRMLGPGTLSCPLEPKDNSQSIHRVHPILPNIRGRSGATLQPRLLWHPKGQSL
jgi:hypothetical protein